MIIKIVRHGESQSNIGEVNVSEFADNRVALTSRGIAQAKEAGLKIGRKFMESAILFRSPYLRTRETSIAMTFGVGMDLEQTKWIEDPLLREIDLGYSGSENQMNLRATHGWFYYRYAGGESPADVYQRCTTFITAMMRKPKKNVVIVSHGLTMRVFLMKFLKLSVEQYTQMKNPENCTVVTICRKEDVPNDLSEDILFENNGWVIYGDMGYYHNDNYDPSDFIKKLKA